MTHMTVKEGEPGEMDDVISLNVGRLNREPEGGTKVRRAKIALVRVRQVGGSESRKIRMARVSRSGQDFSTVSAK
jgi:hypothetical protein